MTNLQGKTLFISGPSQVDDASETHHRLPDDEHGA